MSTSWQAMKWYAAKRAKRHLDWIASFRVCNNVAKAASGYGDLVPPKRRYSFVSEEQ